MSSNHPPKVSVVIPVYNTAPYLEAMFESVLHQTLTEIEILVVNDGSTDNSEEIIAHYAGVDERIKVFHQANKGQSEARNLALQYVLGEYIYFMDSDDILTPNSLSMAYDVCTKQNLDFVFFDASVFNDSTSRKISWGYDRTKYYDEHQVYSGSFLMNDMLHRGIHNCVVWLLLIRTSHLQQLNLKFYPGIIHEDELFTVSLYALSEKVGCLQQKLVRHRVHPTSVMNTPFSMRNVNCYYTVIDQLFVLAKEYPQMGDLVTYFAHYTLSAVYRTAFVLSFHDKIKALYGLCRRGYLNYVDKKDLLKFIFKSKK